MPRYKLLDSLGLIDANQCKDMGSSIDLDPRKLAKGSTIELSAKAAAWLSDKYSALIEPESVKGVGKEADLKGVK